MLLPTQGPLQVISVLAGGNMPGVTAGGGMLIPAGTGGGVKFEGTGTTVGVPPAGTTIGVAAAGPLGNPVAAGAGAPAGLRNDPGSAALRMVGGETSAGTACGCADGAGAPEGGDALAGGGGEGGQAGRHDQTRGGRGVDAKTGASEPVQDESGLSGAGRGE